MFDSASMNPGTMYGYGDWGLLNVSVTKIIYKNLNSNSVMELHEQQKKELLKFWEASGIIKDKELIEAFIKTPREMFVDEKLKDEAYGDFPLPIGYGQTISQPTTVMFMIQALGLKSTDKVLEVGAGSGWNAAVMSWLAKKIYTTEIVPELVNMAKKNIVKIGIKNVEVVECDGSKGYAKAAPYDKIIVTAGAPRINECWKEQLKDNGIILAPVGELYNQKLIRLRKKSGLYSEETLGDFMFVPLKGEHGH